MMEVRKSGVLRTISLILLTTFCPFAYGKIIYVDAEAPPANTGSSWANAYWCLQDALADAQSGDEIRVSQGIYKPDQQAIITARGSRVIGSGDRTATFKLKNGVTIKGGYAGFGEPGPNVRDIGIYETILSGDLNGDDGPNFTNNSENSYHLVTGGGTDATAVLDGLTVTGGNANDTYGYGGGMLNSFCTPTVANCTFSKNHATRGGGIANTGDAGPTLTNCAFSGNSARWGGGMCYWGYCSGTLTNCTFSGNTAENGGAMVITKSSEATMKNCTFTGNRALGGTAGAIDCTGDSSATLVNTILWDNSPSEFRLLGGSLTITYSDVQGGWNGEGNINVDPFFVDADGIDDMFGTKDDNLRLRPGSPCIDAGDNSGIPESVLTDLDGNPRITNGIVDIGAYENIPTPNVYYVDAVNGDDNNDGLTPQAAFVTIQKGIDSALDGEVVLVYPGLYQEEINFMGKSITVQGVVVSPAGAPVLQNPGDFAVSFYSGEGPDSILKNFIIMDSFMGVFIAGSSPAISNLTIVNNKYGIEAYTGSEPDISNCIFWNNTDGDLFGCEVRYSCIERGGEGEGNITLDPLFVDLHNGDYHLNSERGRYWPEHDIWVLDKVTSPCIDGGNPNIYITDEPVPNGGRINMGAYGGTAEASLSPWQLPYLPHHASNPSPADGADSVDLNINLSWTVGLNAVSHDVYFGTSFEDVNLADRAFPLGMLVSQGQDVNSYATGLLEYGQTYYWRIDEVSSEGMIVTGEVWSFTTAGIDGGIKGEYYKGLDFENLVLTRIDPQINFNWGSGGPDPVVGADKFSVRWIGDIEAAFTETYTFYTNSDGSVRLWIDGHELVDRWWYDQNVGTENSGTIDLVAGRTYSFLMEYQARRSNGMVALLWESHRTPKQLVPQAALSLPLKARYPNPANGAIDVKMTPVLTWNQGDYAASHNVYFGTNAQAVRNATRTSPEYKGTESLGNESYNPGKLSMDTSYYWRIDEVNNVNSDSPWTGPVWSFTTADFIVVDDFESYNDLNEGQSGSNRIYLTWIDGYDNPAINGSVVGGNYWWGWEIVHSGMQSMPFEYNNAVGKSEATADIDNLEIGRDWTIEGVSILSLWFRGDLVNAPEPMYVALDNDNGISGVVYHDNPNATQVIRWTEWIIDLQEFADQGVNLTNVNTITLGFGNRNNPVAGGSGEIWFDDIRLYRPASEPAP
jgi:parallel beta-helix repeat protein